MIFIVIYNSLSNAKQCLRLLALVIQFQALVSYIMFQSDCIYMFEAIKEFDDKLNFIKTFM